MTTSPLDAVPSGEPVLVELRGPSQEKWVPSRFNARTVADDGRVILWNTYSGAISVFESRHRARLETLLSQRGFEGPLTGLARYLYDRGFILERDADELRRFRLLYGQQQYRNDILELTLLASEDCNFRCTYCYEDFQRGTMAPSVREGVKNLVKQRARSLRVLHVSWFGGEPLYGIAAIRDLAPFFLAAAEEHELSYSANMTTNGYLLTPEVATDLLAWNIRQFQVTLDGPAITHDQSRKGRNGQKTFSQIYANLAALATRAENFQVNIRINFDKHNFPHLDPFVDQLQSDFAHDDRFALRFRAVGKWGGANDADLETCGLDETRDVQRRVAMIAAKKGFNVETGIQDVNGIGRAVCYAARPFNFVVGADGKLMKCTVALDKQPSNIVGHLQPNGELVLNHDNMSLWTQPSFEDDKTCRSCYALPICQGSACPLVRINTGSRACCGTKANLRHEMLATLWKREATGRTVAVKHG